MTRWFCDQGNNYYDTVNKTCFKRSTLWKRPLWHSHRPTDWFRTLAQSQNILFDDGGDNCNTNETLLIIFFILIWLSLLSTWIILFCPFCITKPPNVAHKNYNSQNQHIHKATHNQLDKIHKLNLPSTLSSVLCFSVYATFVLILLELRQLMLLVIHRRRK